jgi:hypothetical protein
MEARARLSIVAIGCVLFVIGVTTALTHAVPVRTGTNGMLAETPLGGSSGRVVVCQDAELVPASTGAVRVSLNSAGQAGPALAIAAKDGRTTIGRGTLAAGWSGETATIPLRPVTRGKRYARMCVTIGATASVVLEGEPRPADQPATAAGTPLRGRLRFEYLAPDRRSWWSQSGAIARRMSFGHAIGGSTVALLTALLMLGSATLALWQLVRGER